MTKFAIAEIDTDFLFFCGSIYGIFEVLRDFFLSKFIMTFSASVTLDFALLETCLRGWRYLVFCGFENLWSGAISSQLTCSFGPVSCHFPTQQFKSGSGTFLRRSFFTEPPCSHTGGVEGIIMVKIIITFIGHLPCVAYPVGEILLLVSSFYRGGQSQEGERTCPKPYICNWLSWYDH